MHDDDRVDDTVIRPRRQRGDGRGRHATGGPGGSGDLDDVRGIDERGDLDDTVVRDGRGTPLDRAVPGVDRAAPGVERRGAHAAVDTDAAGRSDAVLRDGVSGAAAATAGPASGAGAGEPDAPRPPAPSVRVGGRVIRLDHPVIVGRQPSPPRVVRGTPPELVTVASPTGLVSSSHVLLHAAGSSAVVDDLRSTNGTTVRAPGAAPHRMPAGASIVVLTGTVVDIGDGNTIEVLSPFVRTVVTGDRDTSGPWPPPPSAPGPSRPPRERS